MRYFSMFSGVGGFEHAIRQATKGGWECVGYSEIDKYAVQTYRKQFPAHKNYGNAREIDPDELPDFDLLCGGFPCQSFSIAGKRKGFEDTRGTLFYEICRIAQAKRPRLLLLENVKGLLSADTGRCFHTIITSLDELGYDVEWQVLNSKHFGVPQNRERVFIIGHFRGTSGQQIFPLRQGVGETERMEQGKEIVYHQKSDREIARIYDEKGIAPTLHVKTGGWQEPKVAITNFSEREFGFKEISPALCKRDYKDPKVVRACLTPNRINKRQHGRRFKEDGEPMFTITGQDIHGVMLRDGRDNRSCLRGGRTTEVGFEGQSVRRLTPIECERLQGFPDNWTVKGIDKEGKEVIMSNTQRYKQMGNAVTTNVVQAIVEQMIECGVGK